MGNNKIRTGMLGAIAGMGLVSAMSTQAGTITFNLDYEFSGAQQPQGATPWATAVIDDSFGGANTARLTMTTTNLVDAEHITAWFFNFSGDAEQLAFTEVDVSDATVNAILADNTDSDTALKADGDGFFDFGFDFAPPGNGAALFSAGETIIYDLQYTAAISASDFSVFSAPGGGTGSYLSAAHVQGINDPVYCDGTTEELTGNCGSGWIGAVPIPAAVWLLGSGLVALLVVGRKHGCNV
jgi:hypothetical protein